MSSPERTAKAIKRTLAVLGPFRDAVRDALAERQPIAGKRLERIQEELNAFAIEIHACARDLDEEEAPTHPGMRPSQTQLEAVRASAAKVKEILDEATPIPSREEPTQRNLQPYRDERKRK